MNSRNLFCTLALILLTLPGVFAAPQTEKFRNEKVLVVEQTLAPGKTVSLLTDHASVLVYLDAGSLEATSADGKPRTEPVKRGETVFQPAKSGTVKNAGATELRIVRFEYLGKGVAVTWGNLGLPPNYKVLFENQYGRVYEIRIQAGKGEPLHTHHDRAIICLSGAQIEHIMPDGRRETNTVSTGEIVWRGAVTHVGNNIGKTDLWVIAIEPK